MADRFIPPAGLRPWRQSRPATLREGYELTLLEDCEDAYRITAVVSAEKVIPLLSAFARFLPDEAFFILEYYPDGAQHTVPHTNTPEPHPAPAVFYSAYMPTRQILTEIDVYLERMVHDGFVGFGLANNREGLELFYSEEKVLTFFTDNHLRLCDFLAGYRIDYAAHLILPTDIGHDHLALSGIPQNLLPAQLAQLDPPALDSGGFCPHLVEQLDMYPVEEGLSFFLTRKEQDMIAALLEKKQYDELIDIEFGGLLLDWSDFVTECENGFDGSLEDYHFALRIRDSIQLVIEAVPHELSLKIRKIVAEPDHTFQKTLVDRRKRLDPPHSSELSSDRFWYHGIVRKQGTSLRRDLIRKGWFAR